MKLILALIAVLLTASAAYALSPALQVVVGGSGGSGGAGGGADGDGTELDFSKVNNSGHVPHTTGL